MLYIITEEDLKHLRVSFSTEQQNRVTRMNMCLKWTLKQLNFVFSYISPRPSVSL